MDDLKESLTQYLDEQHDALLWKLDGLGEYDLRRPLTPTGTNLLGLVKHVAAVEAEYFGLVFNRPFPDPPAWLVAEEQPDNVDMWATPAESTASILDFFARVRAHGAQTIAALDLDAPGFVSWWGEGGRPVTDRKSTRLNSSHVAISYAVFCLKKKKGTKIDCDIGRP